VGTMEMGLGVSAGATRTLEDVALATLGRGVKFSAVAVRRFRPVGCTFAASPVVPVTSYGPAHHEMHTQRATFVHGRRRSTRRYIHLSPEWCL
jgi:hypothetical protein